MGGTGFDRAEQVALDAADNVYTVGEFRDTVDFDPGPGVFNLTSAGSSDIFVSKLDSAGNFLWARAMGGTEEDEANGVAVDAAGNVYSVGEFEDTADFDPGVGVFNLTSAGSFDIFVSKLDSAGNFVWALAVGGTGSDVAEAVALDDAGNVHSVGRFQATVDFDPGVGVFNLTSAGVDDIFVLKLDSAGTFIWARAMGGTDTDLAKDVAVDVAGNVYSVGRFEATADFDPGPGVFNLTSAGADDIFVSKLDSAGDFVWARAIGGADEDEGEAVALDAAGDVYSAGEFDDTADFDPGPGVFNLTSAGNDDIFVSKLDSDGNFVWARAIGGTSSKAADDVAVDATGNVYAAGGFRETVDFDPGPGVTNLTSAGDTDIFVLKLGPSGDSDADGVVDGADVCPGTSIPESVPTNRLGKNRWALIDDDTTFDTATARGRGPDRMFTTADTAGCSCEQIIATLGLGPGHTKSGCSISVMDSWVALVGN